MAHDDVHQAPIPPADLNERRIPEHQLNLAAVDLFRIHRKIHSPVFYNRIVTSATRFRWDSATDAFGVLYAAPELITCLAEAVIRAKLQGSLVIEERELEERMYSRLGCAAQPVLKLADLTKDLFAIGADMQICSTSQYDVSNRWSDALYHHPSQFDGIYYASRYTNRPAVAIFDRVRLDRRGGSVRLSEAPEIAELLDAYSIALVPSLDGWE
jgi:hypothetical protein